MSQQGNPNKFLCQYCNKQVSKTDDVGHQVSNDQYFHINCFIQSLSLNFQSTIIDLLQQIPDANLRAKLLMYLSNKGEEQLKELQRVQGQAQGQK